MKDSIKQLLQNSSLLRKDNNLQLAYTMGTTFIACVLIGTAFGYFLYTSFGSIWLFFAFVIFGFLSGIKNVYMDTKKMMKNDEIVAKERNSSGDNSTN